MARRISKAVRNARWNFIHAARRAIRAATGIVYEYSSDLALWYNWANPDSGVLSLAAQVNENTGVPYGPTLVLTRATTASVTDYNNIIKQVNSGEERYTGGRRVENLILQSEEFDTTWTTTRASVVSGVEDPNGGTDGFSLDEDGTATNNHYVTQSIAATPVVNFQGGTIVLSIYAKASNRDWISFNWPRSAGSATASFDLSTGSVGTTGNTVGAGMVDEGDGWYRCWMACTSDRIASTFWYVFINEADNDTSFSGLSQESVLIYGAQVEDVSGQDDPAPSEYQATTTAAVSKWYANRRRTQLLIQTHDMTASPDWSGSNATVAAVSDFPAGVGCTEGYEVVMNSALGVQHKITQSSTYNPLLLRDSAAGRRVHCGFYAKLRDAAIPNVMVQGLAAGNWQRVSWKLADGTIDLTNANITQYAGVDAGNGWWFFEYSYIRASGFTTGVFEMIIDNDIDASAITDGDGVSGIYVAAPICEHSFRVGGYIENSKDEGAQSSDFDTDLTVTGLLVEEARTNICLQSEDQGITWGNAVNSTTSLNAAIAPDGTLTADTVEDDAGTGVGFVGRLQTISSFTVDTVYAVSCYMKADGLDWGYLNINVMGSLALSAFYDLTNGVVGATVGADVTSTFIEDVGNGWFRCGFVFTSDAVDTNAQYRIFLAEGNNDFGAVPRDGTSSIFVWGAQLEAGAFPTSYIPTVAASVTRNDDDIKTTDVSWYNAVEGSLYADVSQPIDSGVISNIVNISDGGASDYVRLRRDTGTDIDFLVRSEFAAVMQLEVTEFADLSAKAVGAYKVNDFELYVDGSRSGTGDQSGALPVGINTINVGSEAVGNHINGHIAEIAYYNTRRIDVTLDDMSTNGITEGATS